MAHFGSMPLPDFTGRDYSVEQKLDALMQHIMRLQQRLEYVLSNLDDDNITREVAGTLDSVAGVKQELAQNSDEMRAVRQIVARQAELMQGEMRQLQARVLELEAGEEG